MSWMPADRLLRWAAVAPLTIAGVAAAAAGAYLDVLAAAAFADPPAGGLVPPTLRLVVLVPAHNEADFVGRCLGSLNAQDYPPDLFQVAVIADNCTDDTKAIAAATGAEVIERKDQLRRGKGYALDFGVRHLERSPPEVVVIIDADCQVGSATIELLLRYAPAAVHVIDIAENGLVELVRDFRSRPKPLVTGELRLLPIDYGSAATERLLQSAAILGSARRGSG